ncbi:MAG: histidine--tRNA ligase [Oscillospiraceae bacterium]
MALIAKRPKGVADVVPADSHKWHTVEKLTAETAETYGFGEIRIPTFEYTKLFVRSVGDTTDVVQKEMYQVSTKGDAEYSLRPEGTAGTLRAVIENGLLNEKLPQKLYYFVSCFRHEKNQKGRFREHHQFGCELIGSADPTAEAELISLAKSVLTRAGIGNVTLNINSIGCPDCRVQYQNALKEFLAPHYEALCETCKTRYERNPMRIVDCKSEICAELVKGAPCILDYICDDCKAHFSAVQGHLAALGIAFEINPKIVRGLDYYTKTVFEFVLTAPEGNLTVCAGGRYDGLIESLGGAPTPALGFGMGLERLIMTMEAQGCDFLAPKTCDIYLGSTDAQTRIKAAALAAALRAEGYWAEYDIAGRGLKAQLKYADKIHAKYSLVLGSNELESGMVQIKNMESGEKTEVSLGEKFIDGFSNLIVADLFGE